MSWSGGTYTKGNSATGGWSGDSALGIGIEAGRHDTQDDDFATGINSCLTKDGQNTATANLPMGAFRHTNVGNASARNDYAAAGQVQDSAFLWGGTSGGSANAHTISLTPAITAYTAGQRFRFIAGYTNTAGATLAVNGLAAKNIYNASTKAALLGNEIMTGALYEVVYDGTQFLLVGGLATGSFTNDVLANNRLVFYKSRGTTAGTNTIVQSGDQLGTIWFYGANGTSYDPAAAIVGTCNGTPGASGDMPGSLQFWTTPDGAATVSQRMVITNAGYAGINQTSPSTRLHVTEDAVASPARFNITATSALSTACLGLDKADNDSTTSNRFVLFRINNTTGSGSITANGANAATFTSTSDQRLKENIEPLPSQLANILALRPVEFDYKDGSGHQLGFIAQDVQKIFPDLIGTNDEGYLTLSDLNKNDARMIKAFQELADKVSALEARVAELES